MANAQIDVVRQAWVDYSENMRLATGIAAFITLMQLPMAMSQATSMKDSLFQKIDAQERSRAAAWDSIMKQASSMDEGRLRDELSKQAETRRKDAAEIEKAVSQAVNKTGETPGKIGASASNPKAPSPAKTGSASTVRTRSGKNKVIDVRSDTPRDLDFGGAEGSERKGKSIDVHTSDDDE